MRRLLRGRAGAFGRLTLTVLAVAGAGIRSASADTSAVTVQITSPLGRSGLPGKVRIVARVQADPRALPPAVRFYVNDTLLATDVDGPPYATEWDDANPFERCRLAVEIDHAATVVRDEVELAPFEIVETTQIMSVGVDALVIDARGHAVVNVDPSEFQLFEDDVPQKLDSVSAEALPATFALLIDTSQSMSKNIGFVRNASGRLTSHLRDIDSVVVAPFRKGLLSVTGPTRDRATVIDAVAAIAPSGGTAILDALSSVTDGFAEGIGHRVVVLVTDGYDEHSQDSINETLQRLKRSHVTVYVVAVGGVAGVSLKGERLLRRIAEETSGRAFFPWNEQQLADVHAAIAADVQHRYRIAYTPANQRQDGSWRTITVRTGNPGHRVKARPGYLAPVPPPIRPSLEFTATGGAHEYVDLTRDDLEVLEDGVRQDVEVFHEAVAPVSIMLALDASGSMKRSEAVARDAARAFVGSLRQDDPLGLIVFADKAELVHDLGTNRERSVRALDAYATQGGTALYDALSDGLGKLKAIDGRRVLVVVTDGRDENAASNGPGSARSWEDVMAQVGQVEATIYAIGIGTKVDRQRLIELASRSGGEAYFTNDVAELEREYRRIVEELRRRYVVAYTSTNPLRDGEWRKVEIRTTRDGVRVRSRGGYYAPAQ